MAEEVSLDFEKGTSKGAEEAMIEGQIPEIGDPRGWLVEVLLVSEKGAKMGHFWQFFENSGVFGHFCKFSTVQQNNVHY